MIIEQADNYKDELIALLASEKLPLADLPEDLKNFLVAVTDGKVIGVIGVEVYGNYGLMRSVAVKPAYRNTGVAGKLLSRAEALSSLNGLIALFLLTETAEAYFTRKGYAAVLRDEVPGVVQASSEFSHVCPVSAIVMKKNLNSTI